MALAAPIVLLLFTLSYFILLLKVLTDSVLVADLFDYFLSIGRKLLLVLERIDAGEPLCFCEWNVGGEKANKLLNESFFGR